MNNEVDRHLNEGRKETENRGDKPMNAGEINGEGPTLQTMHTQPGDRNYNTERRKYDELQNSKLIIEHHLSFANDCISKNIFPLKDICTMCSVQN